MPSARDATQPTRAPSRLPHFALREAPGLGPPRGGERHRPLRAAGAPWPKRAHARAVGKREGREGHRLRVWHLLPEAVHGRLLGLRASPEHAAGRLEARGSMQFHSDHDATLQAMLYGPGGCRRAADRHAKGVPDPGFQGESDLALPCRDKSAMKSWQQGCALA